MKKHCFYLILALLTANSFVFAQKQSIGGGDQRLIHLVVESDPVMLRGNNEQQAEHFLRSKNQKMIDYLVQKYPQYGRPDINIDDPAASWFGLICAMYEAVGFRPLNTLDLRTKLLAGQVPAWLSCALGVLGSSFGITQLVSTLGTFSYASVWATVKFVVKKYVTGWLGTAVALYNIANECF